MTLLGLVSSLKLQNKIKKIKNLKTKLKEVDLLDRHIKNENEVLINNVARLQKENEQLEIEKKKLEKQVMKWYVRSQRVMMVNKILKVKILKHKRRIKIKLQHLALIS